MIWLIILGAAFGIVGGMGMGGGIILIPALTILMSYSQLQAQSLNLAVFFPMAIVAIIIHLKNKLIIRQSLIMIIAGTIGAVGGAVIALNMNEKILRPAFGMFLILIAVFRSVHLIKKHRRV